jgi:hypothetical protein
LDFLFDSFVFLLSTVNWHVGLVGIAAIEVTLRLSCFLLEDKINILASLSIYINRTVFECSELVPTPEFWIDSIIFAALGFPELFQSHVGVNQCLIFGFPIFTSQAFQDI